MQLGGYLVYVLHATIAMMKKNKDKPYMSKTIYKKDDDRHKKLSKRIEEMSVKEIKKERK